MPTRSADRGEFGGEGAAQVTGSRELQLPERVRAALDELSVLALDQQSTQTVLDRVVDLLRGVMPAGADVSMTVVVDGRPNTTAATGQRARELDDAQYRAGEGPCLEAAIGGQFVEIADGRTESRWPGYLPAMLARGARSQLAVPTPAVPRSVGLNVYASEEHAFTDDDRRTALRFADVAAVALITVEALRESRELATNLRAAMESRSVIEQAKGILIERHKVTADQAFRMLTQASQHANRKVRDLAEQLVLTGDLDSGRPAVGRDL